MVCVEREETPILYKRVLLFSPIRSRPVWGGGGLARDFNNQNLIVHLGLGRASWHGTPGLPAITSTASLAVLARRFRADPHEVGRIEGLGLDSLELAEHVDQGQRRPRAGHFRRHNQKSGELVAQGQRRPGAGHCRRLWEGLWGRRLELGANTYRVLVHPTSTSSRIQGDLDVRVPRRSARARASVRRWPWSSRRGRQRGKGVGACHLVSQRGCKVQCRATGRPMNGSPTIGERR